MNAYLRAGPAQTPRTRSAPFGHALAALGTTRDDILGLTADPSNYTDLNVFGEAWPQRYFQMSVAEPLLLAAAVGMAQEGATPFVTTYGAFAERRACDVMGLQVALERYNVKICCALPSLPTRDLAIMRAMPNMTVIDPCDALETAQAVHAIAEHEGPVYMRLLRGRVPLVLDEYGYKFELGKAKLLREGSDVLIISSGTMTTRSLEAAAELQRDGIHVAVLHVPTIKPLDESTIVAETRRVARLIVAAENHSSVGGLGEAVASVLLRHHVPLPDFHQLALPYPAAAAVPTLYDRRGVSTINLCNHIKQWLDKNAPTTRRD